MKILMVSNLYPPDVIGGAEMIASRLAERLADRGHRVRVLTAMTGTADAEEAVHNGVHVHRCRPGARIFPDAHVSPVRRLLHQLRVHWLDLHNARVAQAFRRLVSDEPPDVVHTHNLYGLSPVPWAEAHAAGARTVHTAHDAWLLSPTGNLLYADNAGVLRRRVRQLYARHYMKRTRDVDVMCFPSQHHLDVHHGVCEARETTVVPHGLDPLPAPDVDRTAGREGLGVLFLGQLEPHKGIATLLEAIRRLDPSSGIHFGIAGRGRAEASVTALAETRDDVSFHGYVSGADREAVMRKYDVLVFPSLCLESFGLAVLEGMQRGLAVLVSDIGGQCELVEPGGNGELFKAGSSEALVAALRSLVAAPEALEQMKQSARVKAQQYTLDRMADAYETIYQGTGH